MTSQMKSAPEAEWVKTPAGRFKEATGVEDIIAVKVSQTSSSYYGFGTINHSCIFALTLPLFVVLSQVTALYKLSLSLWGNKPHRGLKAVLFKGSSVADYWRQMALRGQSLGLGNTQSQPCSGWWDTDTQGIYFALRGFQWLQLQCVCVCERDFMVRGGGGRHVAVPQQHGLWRQRFCEVQQFRPAGLECASARQTAWWHLKHFLQPIPPFFLTWARCMWTWKKNNQGNPKINVNFNPILKLNTNSLKCVEYNLDFLIKSRFLPGHVDYKRH